MRTRNGQVAELERGEGRRILQGRPVEPKTELRNALIAAGMLRPGSTQDLVMAVSKLPPDVPVLRLDDAGKTRAAADIAEGATWRGEPNFSPRQSGRRHRRAA